MIWSKPPQTLDEILEDVAILEAGLRPHARHAPIRAAMRAIAEHGSTLRARVATADPRRLESERRTLVQLAREHAAPIKSDLMHKRAADPGDADLDAKRDGSLLCAFRAFVRAIGAVERRGWDVD